MKIIKARFRKLSDLQEVYHDELPGGGMFVATTEQLLQDAKIIIEIICDDLANHVMICATVQSWNRALPRLRVRAGAIVTFAPEEKSKRDFLNAVLSGGIRPEKKRRYSRIPITVPVDYRIRDGRETMRGHLAEISIGGALLQADVLPAIGSELILSILPPGGATTMKIVGHVVHHKPSGAGIKFAFRDGGGARRLQELIRRICLA